MIKRRSAIKPAIGHAKKDGRFGRNLRLILARLRLLSVWFTLTLRALRVALRVSAEFDYVAAT
jgi:hypothetical protein